MSVFGDRLGELMNERAVTDKEVGVKTGLSRSNIGIWRRGEAMPNSQKLIVLCRYFDVSSDWLLGLSNIRKRKL